MHSQEEPQYSESIAVCRHAYIMDGQGSIPSQEGLELPLGVGFRKKDAPALYLGSASSPAQKRQAV